MGDFQKGHERWSCPQRRGDATRDVRTEAELRAEVGAEILERGGPGLPRWFAARFFAWFQGSEAVAQKHAAHVAGDTAQHMLKGTLL